MWMELKEGMLSCRVMLPDCLSLTTSSSGSCHQANMRSELLHSVFVTHRMFIGFFLFTFKLISQSIIIRFYVVQSGTLQKVISNSDRVQVDIDTGKVHFRPVVKGDEGQYRCKAINKAGEDSQVGKLKVLGKLDITSKI